MEVNDEPRRTELGDIPESWRVAPLKDCCIRLNVGFVGTCEPYYRDESSGVLMLRTGNLQGNKLVLDDIKFVSEEFHAKNLKSQVKAGDILIARHGNSGNAVLTPRSIDDANALNIIIVRTNERLLNATFATYAINSDNVRFQAARCSAGSTQAVINTKEVANLLIPLPGVTEQNAIGEVLSDADALIESLEQLIFKKCQIKQGAMQQMLRPKNGWRRAKLGSVGEFLKGSGVKKDECQSGDLPCIRYGEIYTKHNDYIRTFYSFISPTVAASAKRLKTGDLLFAGSGETKEEIGKCVAFVDEVEAYAGGDIVILRPENVNSMFLGYYLNTASIQRQKASRGQGDAVVHISSAALSEIELNVPATEEEQAAIAVILFDMDREIAALETKLAKARQLKQGMMQELLTGRIRLVHGAIAVSAS